MPTETEAEAFTFPRGPAYWVGIVFGLLVGAFGTFLLILPIGSGRIFTMGFLLIPFLAIGLGFFGIGALALVWSVWHLIDRSPSLVVARDGLRFHPADGPRYVDWSHVVGWRFTPGASFLEDVPNSVGGQFEHIDIVFDRPVWVGLAPGLRLRKAHRKLTRTPVGDGNDMEDVARALHRCGYDTI